MINASPMSSHSMFMYNMPKISFWFSAELVQIFSCLVFYMVKKSEFSNELELLTHANKVFRFLKFHLVPSSSVCMWYYLMN